ncbi:MAG: iron-containing alcohol dehydrogenase [Betaproteobacteria bacterium]|nr:iron-containing alcohol dehydrogenase [Betaproteobacteria bacterium]
MQNLISDIVRSFGLPKLKQAAGVVTRRLPIPQPVLLVGPGASARLGEAIGDFGHRKVLIVTDAMVSKLGLMKPLMEALTAGGTPYVVFDAITPDAPIPVVEEGIALFKRKKCDAIIAFGGGSVMDAAKAIGLSAANNKHPRELVGYFKGRHGPAPIYAVPTTAGTGSEVTVAAVISDPEHATKLVIADTRLVPDMAALDPCVMTGLPPAITAATGMDALTHAVEAYIGGWSTAYTDRMALAAIGMIYKYLPIAYRDGSNLRAREKMSLAAAYAGIAFTRANVGNVHAIAHQLGGRYHTPHGLANAIMLPAVLRFSAPDIAAKLAVLAVRTGVGEEGEREDTLARKFLKSVDAMNAALGITRHLEALQETDIPELAKAACWEADSNYPVPRRMTQEDCEALLRVVLQPKAEAKRATRKPSARAKVTPRKKVVAPRVVAAARRKPRGKVNTGVRKQAQ